MRTILRGRPPVEPCNHSCTRSDSECAPWLTPNQRTTDKWKVRGRSVEKAGSPYSTSAYAIRHPTVFLYPRRHG